MAGFLPRMIMAQNVVFGHFVDAHVCHKLAVLHHAGTVAQLFHGVYVVVDQEMPIPCFFSSLIRSATICVSCGPRAAVGSS